MSSPQMMMPQMSGQAGPSRADAARRWHTAVAKMHRTWQAEHPGHLQNQALQAMQAAAHASLRVMDLEVQQPRLRDLGIDMHSEGSSSSLYSSPAYPVQPHRQSHVRSTSRLRPVPVQPDPRHLQRGTPDYLPPLPPLSRSRGSIAYSPEPTLRKGRSTRLRDPLSIHDPQSHFSPTGTQTRNPTVGNPLQRPSGRPTLRRSAMLTRGRQYDSGSDGSDSSDSRGHRPRQTYRRQQSAHVRQSSAHHRSAHRRPRLVDSDHSPSRYAP